MISCLTTIDLLTGTPSFILRAAYKLYGGSLLIYLSESVRNFKRWCAQNFMMNVCCYIGRLRLRVRNRYFVPETKSNIIANILSFWK